MAIVRTAALRSLSLNNLQALSRETYINGKWIKSGSTFSVLNPGTNEEITSMVPNLDQEDCRSAIDAAGNAMITWVALFYTGSSHQYILYWGSLLPVERSKILRRWHDLIMENKEEIAQIITVESGKPINEARGEVDYGASYFSWFADEARRCYGQIIPKNAHGRQLFAVKEPVGVAALITPWNFPLAMITRKIGAALAAGCTVVVKPSELTPLTALAAARLGEEAGLPPGVVNVVTCSPSETKAIGNELCTNPTVKKLSFTGSTAVGKLLMAECASTVKRVSMELGGNAPFIVFDDADIEKAVTGAIASKFRNAGQTCVCANRIYIQEAIHDEFVEKFSNASEQLKVGNGQWETTEMGPLINEAGVEKAINHVRDAISKGGEVVSGGTAATEQGPNFLVPTVIANANENMLFSTEETFGPVAPLFKFTDEDEVVARANCGSAGLASYFFSRDIGRLYRVSAALQYGMIGVNDGIISAEVAPFGGIKESGIGREGGSQGIEDYLNTKYICMSGL
eukprot:m.106113 g.106113  ORF g.106113 m.106113 type:complete len:514 (+) comp13896_c0_seq3:225-1766(+)